MAKESGLGDHLLVGAVSLSNDIQTAQISSPHGTFDVPGINVTAMERILGRKNGRIAGTAYFNPAAGAAHDTLNNLPTTDALFSYLHGVARGDQMASLNAKQINYDGTRDPAGQLLFDWEALGQGFPTEWGQQLTAGAANGFELVAASSPVELAGIDTLASASFGLQSYLHLGGLTGTTVTVTLQDNTTDTPGTYTDITGAAFTAMTAVGFQRIQTARDQTVRRWVRARLTGTFTGLLLSVNMIKNLSTTNF